MAKQATVIADLNVSRGNTTVTLTKGESVTIHKIPSLSYMEVLTHMFLVTKEDGQEVLLSEPFARKHVTTKK